MESIWLFWSVLREGPFFIGNRATRHKKKALKSGPEESEYYKYVDGVVVNHFHQVSVVLIVERLTPQIRKENYVKRPAKGTRKLQIWKRITNLSGTFTKRFYWCDSNNVEFLCLELCKISVSLSFTSRISPLKVYLVYSKGLNIWSLLALINPVSRKQMCKNFV